MTPGLRPRRVGLILCLFAAPWLAPSGCERKTGEPPAVYADEVQSYWVRGIVVQLPDKGPPPRELKIHHEHIPEFVGRTGEIHINRDGVPGMKAMVMEFPELAPGVSLEGLSPSDKIRFEFTVKWLVSPAGDRTPRWLVSAIEPLPADAEISFENKHDHPGPAPASDDGP